MNILSIILIFILLIFISFTAIYLYYSKKATETELSSHGFLGKKLVVSLLVLFLFISSVGISQVINKSNLDNRSLANTSDSLVINYIKLENEYELTGKFENKTSKLVNFEWEIENSNQNKYKISENKEFISKIKVTNPELPIKIILTIYDYKNETLAKKEIIIK